MYKEKINKDAKRWDYVRRNLTQGYSLHMDGKQNFRLLAISKRGSNIDEVIDELIKEKKNYASTNII